MDIYSLWPYSDTKMPLMCKVDHPEGAFHAQLYLSIHTTLMMSPVQAAVTCLSSSRQHSRKLQSALLSQWPPWFMLAPLPRRSCGLWGSFWPYKEMKICAGFPVGGFLISIPPHLIHSVSLSLSVTLGFFFFVFSSPSFLHAAVAKKNGVNATTHSCKSRVNICDQAGSHDNNVYS